MNRSAEHRRGIPQASPYSGFSKPPDPWYTTPSRRYEQRPSSMDQSSNDALHQSSTSSLHLSTTTPSNYLAPPPQRFRPPPQHETFEETELREQQENRPRNIDTWDNELPPHTARSSAVGDTTMRPLNQRREETVIPLSPPVKIHRTRGRGTGALPPPPPRSSEEPSTLDVASESQSRDYHYHHHQDHQIQHRLSKGLLPRGSADPSQAISLDQSAGNRSLVIAPADDSDDEEDVARRDEDAEEVAETEVQSATREPSLRRRSETAPPPTTSLSTSRQQSRSTVSQQAAVPAAPSRSRSQTDVLPPAHRADVGEAHWRERALAAEQRASDLSLALVDALNVKGEETYSDLRYCVEQLEEERLIARHVASLLGSAMGHHPTTPFPSSSSSRSHSPPGEKDNQQTLLQAATSAMQALASARLSQLRLAHKKQARKEGLHQASRMVEQLIQKSLSMIASEPREEGGLDEGGNPPQAVDGVPSSSLSQSRPRPSAGRSVSAATTTFDVQYVANNRIGSPSPSVPGPQHYSGSSSASLVWLEVVKDLQMVHSLLAHHTRSIGYVAEGDATSSTNPPPTDDEEGVDEATRILHDVEVGAQRASEVSQRTIERLTERLHHTRTQHRKVSRALHDLQRAHLAQLQMRNDHETLPAVHPDEERHTQKSVGERAQAAPQPSTAAQERRPSGTSRPQRSSSHRSSSQLTSASDLTEDRDAPRPLSVPDQRPPTAAAPWWRGDGEGKNSRSSSVVSYEEDDSHRKPREEPLRRRPQQQQQQQQQQQPLSILVDEPSSLHQTTLSTGLSFVDDEEKQTAAAREDELALLRQSSRRLSSTTGSSKNRVLSPSVNN